MAQSACDKQGRCQEAEAVDAEEGRLDRPGEISKLAVAIQCRSRLLSLLPFRSKSSRSYWLLFFGRSSLACSQHLAKRLHQPPLVGALAHHHQQATLSALQNIILLDMVLHICSERIHRSLTRLEKDQDLVRNSIKKRVKVEICNQRDCSTISRARRIVL